MTIRAKVEPQPVPFLLPHYIQVPLKGKEKEGVLRELLRPLVADLPSPHQEAILQAILHREAQGPTVLGEGIALPHCKTPFVPNLRMGVGIHPQGVRFSEAPPTTVRLLILIVAPPEESSRYLKLLAQVARLLLDPPRRARLLGATSPEDVVQALSGLPPLLA